MSNLAFYATPIDFNKNDGLEKKLNDTKKNKLNSDLLKKITSPSLDQVKNIHNNEESLKEENEEVLADFYNFGIFFFILFFYHIKINIYKNIIKIKKFYLFILISNE